MNLMSRAKKINRLKLMWNEWALLRSIKNGDIEKDHKEIKKLSPT